MHKAVAGFREARLDKLSFVTEAILGESNLKATGLKTACGGDNYEV